MVRCPLVFPPNEVVWCNIKTIWLSTTALLCFITAFIPLTELLWILICEDLYLERCVCAWVVNALNMLNFKFPAETDSDVEFGYFTGRAAHSVMMILWYYFSSCGSLIWWTTICNIHNIELWARIIPTIFYIYHFYITLTICNQWISAGSQWENKLDVLYFLVGTCPINIWLIISTWESLC